MRTLYLATGKDPTGKFVSVLHDELPNEDLSLHNFEVRKIVTNLSKEDLNLHTSPYFRTPIQLYNWARRSKAEVVMPKEETHEQLEFQICNQCNTMNYADVKECAECGHRF